MSSFIFNSVSEALPVLADYVLKGEEVGSRAGRVKERLHTNIEILQPYKREVLTRGRNASLPAQIAETAWVLAGRDDIKWLSHYLPRAPEFSDNGATWRGAYGPRIRSWYNGEVDRIDQLEHVVKLLREDPLTRRAVIQIYDPSLDTEPGKDIPCNQQIHFTSRLGQLNVHVITRSNDLMWGWSGINAFEWSVLQEIVASMLGVRIGRMHFSITSLHLYDRHWEKAAKLEPFPGTDEHAQFAPAYDSPRFKLPFGNQITDLDGLLDDWFTLEAQIRETGASNVRHQINAFPEPMLRSWLFVLAWWWSRDTRWLVFVKDTPLERAAGQTPRVKEQAIAAPVEVTELLDPAKDDFVTYVSNLHKEKDAAYGDSWKKRGEQLSILANIARKIDRLGTSAETRDETALDTAIDLLVYLIKYRWWLSMETDTLEKFSVASSTWTEVQRVNWFLKFGFKDPVPVDRPWELVGSLIRTFDAIVKMAEEGDRGRSVRVSEMANDAFALALSRWWKRPANEDDYKGADHE